MFFKNNGKRHFVEIYRFAAGLTGFGIFICIILTVCAMIPPVSAAQGSSDETKLTISILDALNQPISSADVEEIREGKSNSYRSDPNGVVNIEIPKDRRLVYLKIKHLDYGTTVGTIRVDHHAVILLSTSLVPDGAQTPQDCIRGIVVDPDGNPVPGAGIEIGLRKSKAGGAALDIFGGHGAGVSVWKIKNPDDEADPPAEFPPQSINRFTVLTDSKGRFRCHYITEVAKDVLDGNDLSHSSFYATIYPPRESRYAVLWTIARNDQDSRFCVEPGIGPIAFEFRDADNNRIDMKSKGFSVAFIYSGPDNSPRREASPLVPHSDDLLAGSFRIPAGFLEAVVTRSGQPSIVYSRLEVTPKTSTLIFDSKSIPHQ
jgi:hypothetical protein